MVCVDINCDMGEGMVNDSLLMSFISSANIACGYHAGNINTIRQTIELCLEKNVAVGIHPSFDDRKNFGRTEMLLGDDELFELISKQLLLFKKVADDCGANIHHVKPHGALYNMAARNESMAAVIAKAVFNFNNRLVFYGLANSCLVKEAAVVGLKTASEAFADRTYQPDGLLTPRSAANSQHKNMEEVTKQVLQIVTSKQVTALNGEVISLQADTVCIHGDGDHAPEFALAIYESLNANNIKISAL